MDFTPDTIRTAPTETRIRWARRELARFWIGELARTWRVETGGPGDDAPGEPGHGEEQPETGERAGHAATSTGARAE